MASEESVSFDVTLSALKYRTQSLLGKFLDGNSPRTLQSGLTSDYRGLADLCGFDVHDIRRFNRFEKPTEVVLREWQLQNKSVTVAQLWCNLEKLERYDIIDELKEFVCDDVKSYIELSVTKNKGENETNVSKEEIGKPVFVCVADGNVDFIQQQLLPRIEDQWGLRVYLEQRDMLGGEQWSSETAEMLAKRCMKVLVILSKEFLSSDACNWVLNYAQAQSVFDRQHRVIPLVIHAIERKDFPTVLQGLSTVDLTRGAGDPNIQKWAWQKLKKSLTS